MALHERTISWGMRGTKNFLFHLKYYPGIDLRFQAAMLLNSFRKHPF